MNENQVMISMAGSIFLIEKTKADDLILSEFLISYNFVAYFLFKFNFYDEQNDEIMIAQLVKVINLSFSFYF